MIHIVGVNILEVSTWEDFVLPTSSNQSEPNLNEKAQKVGLKHFEDDEVLKD